MKLLRTTALTAALITAAVPILTSSAEAWRGGGWRGGGWRGAGIGWGGGGWGWGGGGWGWGGAGGGVGGGRVALWRVRLFVILRVCLRLPRLWLWHRLQLSG